MHVDSERSVTTQNRRTNAEKTVFITHVDPTGAANCSRASKQTAAITLKNDALGSVSLIQ